MSTARVVLSSGFSRRYTGGKREFDIEAKSLRDVMKALDELYPGLGEHLEEETLAWCRRVVGMLLNMFHRSVTGLYHRHASLPRPPVK